MSDISLGGSLLSLHLIVRPAPSPLDPRFADMTSAPIFIVILAVVALGVRANVPAAQRTNISSCSVGSFDKMLDRG